jgi:peptidoglycan/xylan/chitin deacetylase (PgdA/CDA1 family)
VTVRVRRWLFGVLTLALLAQSVIVALPALAQDGANREAGKVVGTTGLNIRSCPRVNCPSEGLAQLNDPIVVTGDAENGFLPVEWRGKAGWAWRLYVATPSRGTPALVSGTPGCNRVALIFNIGIGYPVQIEALRWLKAQSVPATIFPMGWWALASPEDMKAIADLGFPIGSHGDVRLNLTGFSDDEVIKDVRDSMTHIGQVIGKTPVPYFTPYAADMDERVRALVAGRGILPVSWDVPADAYGEGITPEYVYDRVVPNVEDGSIVEFHIDGPSSAESTAVAIPWIVSDLKAQGFTFVTIPDMAQPCGAPKIGAATPIPASATPSGSPAASPSATVTPAATTTPAP